MTCLTVHTSNNLCLMHARARSHTHTHIRTEQQAVKLDCSVPFGVFKHVTAPGQHRSDKDGGE